VASNRINITTLKHIALGSTRALELRAMPYTFNTMNICHL